MHLINGRGQSLARFIHVNVELTGELVERALAAGIRRFVFCSSMTVLVGNDLKASGPVRLDERWPLQADHPYSISKAMVEELARGVARRGDVSTASLRFMGFGHDCEGTGPQLLARVLTPRDAAVACLLAVEHTGMRGEVFNIGSGTPLTDRDIADAQEDPWATLERLFPGCGPVLAAHAPNLSPSDFWPVCDNTKARNLLGYEPQDTFKAWLCAHGWQPG
jgi:nucleoside-diphosphate-sugar epimerase